MKYYVVDSFTDHVFGGGPAGVVISDEWLSDELMQNISMENGLPDTAFVVGDELRWFMPEGEINLNGHATLAAAAILNKDEITFKTKSGNITVTKEGDYFCLNMPAVRNFPTDITDELVEALGKRPAEAYFGENYFLVYDSPDDIRNLTPDFNKMKALPLGQGVFVSAVGDEGADIVGRTFWPKQGVNEDSVCGNMHCNLTPFWCERLGKKQLVSRQLSKRGATVICEDLGDRVLLKGQAVLVFEGVNLQF